VTRAVAGAVCRQLLAAVGVRIWSYVDQMGPIRAFPQAASSLDCVPASTSLAGAGARPTTPFWRTAAIGSAHRIEQAA
jgi:hypothetical protein